MGFKRRFLKTILGIILFSVTFVYGRVMIDEVMYDFPGTDTKHEWIEISNIGESLNLSSWKLREGGVNHALTLVNGVWTIDEEQSIIIADDASTFLLDYPTFNSTLFDSAFSSGLSGSGEELVLIDAQGKVIDNLVYNTSLGATGNGLTLCYYNFSWQECLATPGRINEINLSTPNNNTNTTPLNLPNLKITPYLISPVYSGITYDDLFKLTIDDKNCSQKNSINVTYNISSEDFFIEDKFQKEVGCSSYASTGIFFPILSGNYTLCALAESEFNESSYLDNQVCFEVGVLDLSQVPCDQEISISLDEDVIYQQGESISYDFTVSNSSFPFTIEYWVEDLFGRMVKSKYNSTNANAKTWKADILEEDRVLLLKANLYSLCNDTNLSNNHIKKRFIVTNQGEIEIINNTNTTNVSDSSLSIIKLTPSEPKCGDALKMEVEVYKGNTNKYALYAWVEQEGNQVSEVTKVNLRNKNTLYGLSLPIQLDMNCDEDDQDARVVIEGLDQREEIDILIRGDASCEEDSDSEENDEEESSSVVEEDISVVNEKIDYGLIGIPNSISSGGILNFRLKIKNDEWDHFFQMYSYVYRGSRCYSCQQETLEREDSLQELMLGFEEEAEVLFSLTLDGDMKEGEYKLKVKIHKDGQITGESVDTTLTVGEVQEQVKEEKVILTSNLNEEEEVISSQRIILNQSKFLVYESSDEKAKKFIPYLLIVVLGLLCIILIKKR